MRTDCGNEFGGETEVTEYPILTRAEVLDRLPAMDGRIRNDLARDIAMMRAAQLADQEEAISECWVAFCDRRNVQQVFWAWDKRRWRRVKHEVGFDELDDFEPTSRSIKDRRVFKPATLKENDNDD